MCMQANGDCRPPQQGSRLGWCKNNDRPAHGREIALETAANAVLLGTLKEIWEIGRLGLMSPVKLVLLASYVVLVGCSTSYLMPDIGAFGSAVANIVDADKASPSANSLPGRVAAARRSDFAAARVLYSQSNEAVCSYNEPALRPQPFSTGCVLVPMWLDPSSDELVIAASQYDTLLQQVSARHVIPAGNQELLKELLAFRLRDDLLSYATQLQSLAQATEPADISTSLGVAFDAISKLGDEISRAEVVTGTEHSDRRATRKTLATTLASEVLETWRYNLLKSLVHEADQNVQAAATQLAILTYRTEQTGLRKKKDEFEASSLNQVPGSASSLKKIEDRHVALAKADQKASFRRYAAIGQTHGAIVQALNAPADLERLAAANKRIVALAEAIKAIE